MITWEHWKVSVLLWLQFLDLRMVLNTFHVYYESVVFFPVIFAEFSRCFHVFSPKALFYVSPWCIAWAVILYDVFASCILHKVWLFIFWFSGFFFFLQSNCVLYLLRFCSYIISYHFSVRYSPILFYKCVHILFYIEFSNPSGIFFAVCTNVKIYLVLFSKCLNLPGAVVSSQFLCSSLQRTLLRSKPACCLSIPSFHSDASCQHHQQLYIIRFVGPCLISDSLAHHSA